MNKVWMPMVIAGLLGGAGCQQERMEGGGAASPSNPTGSRLPKVAPPGMQATNAAAITGHPDEAIVATGEVRPRRFAALLDSEKSVMEGAGVSAARVTGIIRTERFEKFVRQLQAEAATDPLAQDVTVAERARWERQLQGQGSLREFGCGLSVCAGTIELGSNPALYDRIVEAFMEDGAAGGSLLDHRVDLGNGHFEQRFVMSHDPSVRGITFNGRPRGK